MKSRVNPLNFLFYVNFRTSTIPALCMKIVEYRVVYE